MSSVWYGLEDPPPAFALLREWIELGGDEFALFQRLLVGAQRGEWDTFWRDLAPGTAVDDSERGMAQLIRTLGLPAMRRHLGLAGLRRWSRSGVPAYRMSSAQYVAFGLSSAIVGEALAERTGQNVTAGFMAGLFGGLGLIPVSNLIGRVHPGTVFPGSVTALSGRIRWERELIRYDSLVVGGELLDRWGFPSSLSTAIRGLAYPLLVANGRPFTMLAHLAVRMAPMVVLGDASSILDRVARKCFEMFGLPPSVIAELANEASARMSELVYLEWPEAVSRPAGRRDPSFSASSAAG